MVTFLVALFTWNFPAVRIFSALPLFIVEAFHTQVLPKVKGARKNYLADLVHLSPNEGCWKSFEFLLVVIALDAGGCDLKRGGAALASQKKDPIFNSTDLELLTKGSISPWNPLPPSLCNTNHYV